MKFFCLNCEEFFEDTEAETIKEDPSPAGVSLPEGYYEYKVCPHCGSDYIDEAYLCPVCGEYHSPHDREEICNSCAEDIDKSFEAMIDELSGKYGKDYKDLKEIILDRLAEEY